MVFLFCNQVRTWHSHSAITSLLGNQISNVTMLPKDRTRPELQENIKSLETTLMPINK